MTEASQTEPGHLKLQLMTTKNHSPELRAIEMHEHPSELNPSTKTATSRGRVLSIPLKWTNSDHQETELDDTPEPYVVLFPKNHISDKDGEDWSTSSVQAKLQDESHEMESVNNHQRESKDHEVLDLVWNCSRSSEMVAQLPLDDQNLCHQCRMFTYSKFSQSTPDSLIASFDVSPEALITSECALCRLFGSSCSLRAFAENATRGNSYIKAPVITRIHRATGFYKALRGFDYWESQILLRVSIKDSVTEHSSTRDGLIHVIDSRQPVELVRRIGENQADLTFVRHSVHQCLANHGGDCQSEVPTIDKLRVIDCRLRTVVPAPPNCSYAALSYVWSQVHSAPQLNQEASKTLPSRMPRLVEDSLAVALQLGYSYIWIDRYCIDQLDEETKHMQIRQMDQIYAAAKVTIIAAGDQHPSGLHGASGTPRRYHSHVHLRDCTLVSTLPTLEYAIEQSPWSKRGWTYQEMILSKRRVYFTPWQVYYECNTTHHRESALKEMSQDRWFGSFKILNPLEIDLMSHIAKYRERNLSFEIDALNAMEGIFRQYEARKSTTTCMGIVLENTLLKEESASLIFIRGLSWFHYSAAHSRTDWPSWTWAGWKGGFIHSYLLRPELSPASQPMFNIRVEDDERTITEITAPRIISTSSKRELYRYLHVEAPILDLEFAPSLSPTKRPWRDFKLSCFKIISNDSIPKLVNGREVFVHLDMQEDMAYRLYQLEKPHRFVAALLGFANEQDGYDGVGLVLVLVDKGTYYERIGMANSVTFFEPESTYDAKPKEYPCALKSWGVLRAIPRQSILIG